MKNGSVCIIVPCHNEGGCIEKTLQDLRGHCPEVWITVVNDASTDRTAAIVREYQKRMQRLVLLELPINLGIGGAMQTGFRFAARHEFQYAVKFDGDGQHPADRISALLEPLERGEADLAISSRFLKHDGFQSTPLRRMGIAFFRCLNSLLIRQTITDNTSGFRAYNHKALEFAAEYYPSFDYPEPEEVVLFARNGFRLTEVPVAMRERQGGCSSINCRRAMYYMCKVGFSVIMAALRPREKRNG